MSQHRAVRTSLLSAAVAVTLLASAGQAVSQTANRAPAAAPAPAAVPGTFTSGAPGANPFDQVDHLASPKEAAPATGQAPGGLAADGRVPGAA
ncbi:collagenase, partial [Streptomyces sp. SID7760]|nr:collagenase [Streptomyces sp. SID7760]